MAPRQVVRRRRSLLSAVVLLLLAAPEAAGGQTGFDLTPVRVIGGPGHAGLYGWGADTLSDGTVIISDYWNYRVQRFALDGSLIGTVVPDDGNHFAPYDVAVDTRNDTIYVGDVDDGRHVDKYDLAGNYLGSLGAPGTFSYPAWLDVDSNGRVAVADSRLHRIVVFDDQGNELYRFGSLGSGPGQLRTPRGMAFDVDDTLYVLEAGNRRVQAFDLGDTEATSVRTFRVSGADLRGLAIHPGSRRLYVVNEEGYQIGIYTRWGRLIRRFGGVGDGPGLFLDGGRGITIDGNGDVWVGDMPSFRAQVFRMWGTYVRSAPEPPQPPPPGGFAMPGGVAVGPDGDLFVTDTFNWRIQRLAPDGTPKTAWGTRNHLNYARGIAVDQASGTVIVGNTDAQNLRAYGPNGRDLWVAPGVRTFSVSIGPDGQIYAPDFAANVIQVYGLDGTLLRTIRPAGLSDARGIEVDADGSLWVSNQGHGFVFHLSPTGELLGAFGGTGSEPWQLVQPGDVEVDDQYVYVADQRAHRIKVWTKDGTFVGAFGRSITGIGGLFTPMGLDLTADGRLYIAEFGGERIHEFVVIR